MKRAVLLAATLGSFLTPFMGSSINIALPTIGRELSMDAVLLGWLPTAYLLAAAVFLVPIGKVADIYGRKRVFTVGIWIDAVSSVLCALAGGSAWLIGCRVVQGIGNAMMFGTGVAMLTSVFPSGQRGKALGINVAAVYLGLSLGPFLGGLLTQYLGWRSIFWANALVSAMVRLFVLSAIKQEWAEAKGERLDIVGSVLYGVMLILLMYGLTLLPARAGLYLVGLGIAGLGAFIRWEIQTPHPVLDMKLFLDNRVFAFSNLAALINYSATFGVGLLLSLYLQFVKGLDPAHAGLVLVAQPVVMSVFSPFAGRLSDRVESRIVASVGMGLIAISLSLLSFLNEQSSLAFVIACLLLLGLGFALFSSPNTNAVMGSVESKFYGVASATLGTMRLTGQMLSLGLVMWLLTVYVGKVPITPEVHAALVLGTGMAFRVFAAFCACGVWASWIRGMTGNLPAQL
ncbi:MAG: MFS transporter [Candidatus Omnitrophica bacterium]|nr:MFS transporter [Candidatus Omnitrophota bacterium]